MTIRSNYRVQAAYLPPKPQFWINLQHSKKISSLTVDGPKFSLAPFICQAQLKCVSISKRLCKLTTKGLGWLHNLKGFFFLPASTSPAALCERREASKASHSCFETCSSRDRYPITRLSASFPAARQNHSELSHFNLKKSRQSTALKTYTFFCRTIYALHVASKILGSDRLGFWRRGRGVSLKSYFLKICRASRVPTHTGNPELLRNCGFFLVASNAAQYSNMEMSETSIAILYYLFPRFTQLTRTTTLELLECCNLAWKATLGLST